MLSEEDKVLRVDRWLEDVSAASARWRTAKAAQQSVEGAISYLEEIRSHMGSMPADMQARMDSAIAKNRDNLEKLVELADRQADLESGFYEALPLVRPPEVAEAWRMRCIEGKTWLQCSMALHYNRQHLERLSRRAKVAVYEAIPERYRECHRIPE